MKAENCTYPWSAFGFQLCAFHILCICSHGLMLCVSTQLLLSMHVCVYTADSKHACVLCGANHVWLLLRCAVSLSTSPSVATGSERQSTELPDIWKSKNDSLLRLDQFFTLYEYFYWYTVALLTVKRLSVLSATNENDPSIIKNESDRELNGPST